MNHVWIDMNQAYLKNGSTLEKVAVANGASMRMRTTHLLIRRRDDVSRGEAETRQSESLRVQAYLPEYLASEVRLRTS